MSLGVNLVTVRRWVSEKDQFKEKFKQNIVIIIFNHVHNFEKIGLTIVGMGLSICSLPITSSGLVQVLSLLLKYIILIIFLEM